MHAHSLRHSALLAALISSLASACAERESPASNTPPDESIDSVQQPVFANGDFEDGSPGVAPPDWTVTPLMVASTGIVYPPQTSSDLNLSAGSTLRTFTLQASGPESQPDPDLGVGASLRWPKYGNKVAIVNQKVTGRVVNSMKQTMTIGAGDIDPADGKAHVRFAVAPVLQNPLHPAHQQPFYWVQLRNLTKNTVLYRDFNASAQPGVPWKTVGTSLYYTDWQLVDIAPGGAALAIGDQVELEVIAAGCAQSGHWGHVYVDGVGATVPGLFVSATGPSALNAGEVIVYKLSFKNGGTGSASNVKVDFNTPPNTTFHSWSAPGLSCTAPNPGATGLLSCTIGTVAPGSSGNFEVAVRINSGATGIITNGNYSISGTGITPLLGPKVYTTVTSGVSYADVAVTKTNNTAGVAWGQPVSYTIVATNNGPSNVSGVTLTDTLPAQLSGGTWTCVAAGSASCPASGSGNINASISLPVGGTTTFTLNANVIAGSGSGSVSNTATATLPASASDTDTTNNSAVDTDSIGELRSLTVTKAGNGLGSIVSSPAAINCGASCSSASGSFVSGTTVVLNALPGVGDAFAGWGGACSGSSPTCTLTVNADTSVTATFNALPKANGAACADAAGCSSGNCVDGVCCNSACGGGSVGDCQACNIAGSEGTCSPLSAGTECRAAGGDCDLAEVCNGTATSCPADAFKSSATTCRASAGDCDNEEKCTGSSASCPADAFKPSSSVCRAAAGDCDVAETCSGSSADCPSDALVAAGTECRAASCSAGVQTSSASCSGGSVDCPALQTQACGTFACGVNACLTSCSSAADCVAGHYCSSGACLPLVAQGASCSSDVMCATGQCVDGVCCNTSCGGGAQSDCQACNLLGNIGTCAPRSAGTVCRAAAGDCDVAEICNGSATACPSDGFEPSSTVCRAAAGDCDLAESCSGSSASCPNDALVAAGSECRGASCTAGIATSAAVCSGSSTSCPPIQTQTCDAYVCGPTACLTTCSTGADCSDGNYCESGTCLPELPLAAACSSDVMCGSGHCTDGVCCDLGCSGQCEACDVTGSVGSCIGVSGAPHGGRPACDSDGSVCGGSCDGSISRSACQYPSATTSCRAASCTDGVATLPASCDGSGSCPALTTQACAPFTCGATQCLGDCSVDTDCASGNYCSAGVCTPKLALGTSCSADNACQSGHCIDGVCCDGSCSGQCEACDVAGALGQCSPVSGAPHGSRPACASDGSLCGGACDGVTTASCSYPGTSTECRAASCTDDIATLAAHCDAAGACPSEQTQACAPFTCGPSACLGDCTVDSECQSTSFCSGGVCTAKLTDGAACSGENQCQSGQCVDGVCCNSACGGQCEACDVSGLEGTCSPVSGAPHGARPACSSDGSACGGACDGVTTSACAYPGDSVECRAASCESGVATLAASCDGAGACPEAIEQACGTFACGDTACNGDCTTDAQCADSSFCAAGVCSEKRELGLSCSGDNQCQSGRCVDGVCCDSACEGQCEACNADGSAGTCTPISGAPRGDRPACSGQGTCAGSCDGENADACSYPGADTSCGDAHCTDGVSHESARCDSAGACTLGTTTSCGAYTCSPDEPVCRTTCSSDSDCALGNVCRDSACVIDSGVGDGGVPASPDGVTLGGTCACSTPGSPSGGGKHAALATLIAGLALAVTRRRRRDGASVQ